MGEKCLTWALGGYRMIIESEVLEMCERLFEQGGYGTLCGVNGFMNKARAQWLRENGFWDWDECQP